MGGMERATYGCRGRWRGLYRATTVSSQFQWQRVEVFQEAISLLEPGEVEICSVGLPISCSRGEGKVRRLVRNRSGTNGMLDGWLRKRPDSLLTSLSRSRSNLAGGAGAGVVPHPWMRGRLALRGLSWWGRTLTTVTMGNTATAGSTAAFTAEATWEAAGSSGADERSILPAKKLSQYQ